MTSPTSNTAPETASDFSIGERVWVNGNKPGYVQFIGGTQFAPGQWAGIVLDEPIGKNDGSVAGIRYFQCEEPRGIFTRPSKLSRTPVAEREANGTETAGSKTSTSQTTPSKPVPDTKTANTPTTTKNSANLTRDASGSTSNLSETDSAKKLQREFKLSDRVLVRSTSALSLHFLILFCDHFMFDRVTSRSVGPRQAWCVFWVKLTSLKANGAALNWTSRLERTTEQWRV